MLKEIEEMGMTNEQYKGILIDQLEVWQELQEMLEENKTEEAKKKIQKQIDKINEKLKF